MAAGTPREAALRLLSRVFRENAFASDLFEEESAGLSERDRAFLRTLSYGVLERKCALDWAVSQKSSTPLSKMKPKIRLILEIGTYELLFLQAADYAAVNEAVRLTKKTGYGGLSGFVNAVLRAVQREKEKLIAEMDPWTKAGISGFLREKLSLWYGEGAGLRIAEAALSRTEGTMIRRNRFFAQDERAFTESLLQEGCTVEKTGLSRESYRIGGKIPAYRLESFKKGLFYIQDPSSCLAGDAVSDLADRAAEPYRILDVSAAPGGKILHLQDLFMGRADALACDLTEKRTDLIRENLGRMPYPGVRILEEDACVYNPAHREAFDLVAADLPCSGLGTLRKNPELRYRTDEESLREIADLQKRILGNIRHYVKRGGTLLYSTCTLNPSENSEQIRAFLRENTDFVPASFEMNLPEMLRGKGAEDGMLQILPSEFPGDGFFIARLEKTV